MSADQDVEVLRAGRAPGAWPGLGHVPVLMRDPLRLLGSLPGHGDLVEIRLGRRPVLMLCHPDLARQVLTDFGTFDRGGPIFDKVREALGSGLASAPRADHRRLRLVMQPAFRRQYLPGYADAMSREIVATMDVWADGGQLDMVTEMFGLTTGIVLRALFSTQVSEADADRLQESLDTFLKGIYLRAILPSAARLPLPANRRYARALTSWRQQVQDLIGECRRSGASGDNLISRLVRASDSGDEHLSDRELSDQVAVLLLAGGETTASAGVWALHLLDRHPDVLAALRTEADEILGGRVATWDDLPRLELTARVIRETLRLYPPAWVTLRAATRQTTIAGRTIPPGTMLIFSPYVLHRRADLFPDPDQFLPDRWLAQDTDQANPRRGSFLPFGTGATRCIGEEFGIAEAALILSSLITRWNFTPRPGTAVTAQARAVLAPRAYPVRLTSRT